MLITRVQSRRQVLSSKDSTRKGSTVRMSALDATSCQFAAQFKGAILSLLKQCPWRAAAGSEPPRTALNGSPPNLVRRAVFAEMNHSDAIIALVFLVASVIWLSRLSDK